MGHFLQITIGRNTLPFLKKNHTYSRDRELQKWASFCKLRSQEKRDHFSRKTTQFLVITNCRNGPLSSNYDRKKNYTISQEILYNFSRKTIQFLVIANCRNGPLSANHDRKKYSTISQEILYNFSRKTIQFLVIANCRNGPLSANYDRKKNYAIFLENYTVYRDRSFQKLTGRTASDSLEI